MMLDFICALLLTLHLLDKAISELAVLIEVIRGNSACTDGNAAISDLEDVV